MSPIKRLTGLIGNGILIVFVMYLSVEFFSWAGSCLFSWSWIEPGPAAEMVLVALGIVVFLIVISYVIEATFEVWGE